jgi:hypothetical protein
VFQFIDGKQRTTTVIKFVKGEFPITVDGKEYYYNDLDERCQSEVNHWNPKADVGYSYVNLGKHPNVITDDEKIEWFLRVNFTGTPQEETHEEMLTKLYIQK